MDEDEAYMRHLEQVNTGAPVLSVDMGIRSSYGESVVVGHNLQEFAAVRGGNEDIFRHKKTVILASWELERMLQQKIEETCFQKGRFGKRSSEV